MRRISDETLLAIQRHFHAVIRERAGRLIDEHRVELPDLRPLLASDGTEPVWFPVPGMYGGFKYWLEGGRRPSDHRELVPGRGGLGSDTRSRRTAVGWSRRGLLESRSGGT